MCFLHLVGDYNMYLSINLENDILVLISAPGGYDARTATPFALWTLAPRLCGGWAFVERRKFAGAAARRACAARRDSRIMAELALGIRHPSPDVGLGTGGHDPTTCARVLC